MPEDFDPVAYINEPRWRSSRLGLERIAELMERLGNPESNLRIIHVAGTNGKGSTCAFIASILKAAGYRTGLFSSPYIMEFSDRITVDGTNISPDDLLSVTLEVREQAEAMEDHPTEFELMTAVAFVYFARSNVEFAVMETGLGGRLDSTNVVDYPELCVITPISFDHMDLLGSTIAQIAEEKAGIIKTRASVVSAEQDEEAWHVIRRQCTEHGCVLTMVDKAQLSGRPADFTYKGYEHLRIGLLGSYQMENAALAIEAIERLRTHEVEINDDAVRAGLAATRWPGRFEIIGQNPTFIVDGGHNEQGAQALIDSLELNFPGRHPIFIIGVLADKDYAKMLEIVLPYGEKFICIAPPNPRALSSYKLARALRFTCQDMMGCTASHNTLEAKSIPDAVDKALELAGPDGLVCAFGSLYSVGDIKRALEARQS